VTITYDLAVVGAGIVGLAHALAAVRRGLSVVILDRDQRANGASVRNFGFITVTGQQAGACWARAKRSRDVWAEIAPQAGIAITQRGLAVAVRYPESEPVLEAFLDTGMGEACALLTPAEARSRVAALSRDVRAVLWSPHEIRVESRDAIPRLAAWLETSLGVTILRGTQVRGIALPRIDTSAGPVSAKHAVVCPGDDFLGLYPDRIARFALSRCKLHMMRLRPLGRIDLGAAVMSDLGLARYLGYAELPEAGPLKARLAAERAEALDNGVHLIAVQSADGSLVVGDSHHYDLTPDPFSPLSVDRLILEELDAVLDIGGYEIVERWTGTYASAADRLMLVDAPGQHVRIVIVTSGTGASTAFAIGEEVVADLFGSTP
jgi:FAD dependent oxidoreductase TIGR03364